MQNTEAVHYVLRSVAHYANTRITFAAARLGVHLTGGNTFAAEHYGPQSEALVSAEHIPGEYGFLYRIAVNDPATDGPPFLTGETSTFKDAGDYAALALAISADPRVLDYLRDVIGNPLPDDLGQIALFLGARSKERDVIHAFIREALTKISHAPAH